MASLKGPGEAKAYDGSNLRIGIVHARWNSAIIDALVSGAKQSLAAAGVKEDNIVVQSVPGSYELPFAVQRMYTASQIQSTSSGSGGALATDLLSSTSATDLTASSTKPASAVPASSTAPFDAIIAVGVLIKGETMHFEYIAEAASQGLMRVQLDQGVPVVFGLLTALSDEQAKVRAGLGDGAHNHGEDWGRAAVELGVKKVGWAEGKIVE
ncbi:6,7-dimethyl-8-ribityllumazine synthase [Lineolata rhizophorae]|uniref:6,7-dimethyl-8-ribityllumazine synthase n=1 Tax=Lineolata rhizophorae TaxID=578093 RepID=A0A6A6NSN0_9PEZI|nr:6,7-dimethyl-8-ribityllumazine synthase [Lineolata rhizophorae]